MFLRISLLFVLLVVLVTPTTYAAVNIEDSAWILNRVLRHDTVIRTNTWDTLHEKRRRGELLTLGSQNIANLLTTWNLIPTTDKTLEYTLTLQKYKLSCEIAAMKAIFGALWYPRTEDQIISTLPHHNKPMDTRNGIWWDPDNEFVWLYQWSQNGKTGYGIYEWAIATYFMEQFQIRTPTLQTEAWNENTRPIQYTNESHLTHLLDTLDTGGHIILWWDWCTAPGYEDGILGRDKTLLKKLFPIPGKNKCSNYKAYRYYDWKTKDGKTIKALSWDHVFVLLGYIGTKESPSHIIVWDTDTGRHIYPITEWMRKWWLMQYRSLIVNK